jgi:uncharacterized tellurite resistance protein B-like protein
MLERLVSFFRTIEPGASLSAGDDPRIAAAALMHHVMEADGVSQEAERLQIRQALAETYGVSGLELDVLAAAGENADHEAIDLYAFTSVLKRHLDQEGRKTFIRLLWEVVMADGELHELEDHTVWRVAELIGVDRNDRIAAKRAVQAERGVAAKIEGAPE